MRFKINTLHSVSMGQTTYQDSVQKSGLRRILLGKSCLQRIVFHICEVPAPCEICEVPAPLAEGNLLSSVVLGCVLWDSCTGLARIAPIRHRRLKPMSLCIHAAFSGRWTFEAAPPCHGGGDGGEGGTSGGVNDIRMHSFLSPQSFYVAVSLYPCDS